MKKSNVTVVKGLLGRNEKGQFVNLSKVTVSAKETKKTKRVKAAEVVEATAPATEAPAEAKPIPWKKFSTKVIN